MRKDGSPSGWQNKKNDFNCIKKACRAHRSVEQKERRFSLPCRGNTALETIKKSNARTGHEILKGFFFNRPVAPPGHYE